MEDFERAQKNNEALRRRQITLKNFTQCIVGAADPELSYYCLILNYDEIDQATKNQLLDVILADRTLAACQFAFKLLRDQPRLPTPSRDALFKHVIDLADGNTCRFVLDFVRNLGPWEDRLRAVLEK